MFNAFGHAEGVRPDRVAGHRRAKLHPIGCTIEGTFASMALATVLRAVFGYLFLILVVRIVGRRPGKQLTPFEFVLIFFLGGLTLTGIVGEEMSFTNAVCQIVTIACTHYLLVWMRTRSSRFARLMDGTPLILVEGGYWRTRTMQKMHIAPEDVLAVVRDQGLKTALDIHTATLERNGEISLIPKEEQ
jgi:uncharacterized membrane protein YcaP (DUF421 family)